MKEKIFLNDKHLLDTIDGKKLPVALNDFIFLAIVVSADILA
jgi:hypothetical protein